MGCMEWWFSCMGWSDGKTPDGKTPNTKFLLIFHVINAVAMIMALVGTWVVHMDDASIQSIAMVNKRMSNVGVPWTNTEINDNLLGVYDIQLRTPYADITRYSTVDLKDDASWDWTSKTWEANWYRYKNRHFMPSTKITYNMAEDYSINADKCHDLCHGNFKDGNGGVGEADASIVNRDPGENDITKREEACYLLVPGCAQFGPESVVAHLTHGQLETLTISDGCRERLALVRSSGRWLMSTWRRRRQRLQTWQAKLSNRSTKPCSKNCAE